MTELTKEQKCKHSHGFYLHNRPHAGYPAVYACNWRCGYWLPFHPAMYPEGIVYTCEPVGKLGKISLVADEGYVRNQDGSATKKLK